jgi:beta-lactamase regulating signal transducer with metallopeptidase domain
MDFSFLIWALLVIVVICIGFWILRTLIMPVVPAGLQPLIWAIIGIFLLIALLIFIGGYGSHPFFHRPY